MKQQQLAQQRSQQQLHLLSSQQKLHRVQQLNLLPALLRRPAVVC
jgi:hypothetical protein